MVKHLFVISPWKTAETTKTWAPNQVYLDSNSELLATVLVATTLCYAQTWRYNEEQNGYYPCSKIMQLLLPIWRVGCGTTLLLDLAKMPGN